MGNRLKNYLIWAFIVILVIFIVALVLVIPGKEKSFEIKDRCGPIMNLISHTIQDESVCKTRCKSQCGTMELAYSRIDFKKYEVGCNSCTCFCKEGMFRKQ